MILTKPACKCNTAKVVNLSQSETVEFFGSFLDLTIKESKTVDRPTDSSHSDELTFEAVLAQLAEAW